MADIKATRKTEIKTTYSLSPEDVEKIILDHIVSNHDKTADAGKIVSSLTFTNLWDGSSAWCCVVITEQGGE